MAWDQKRKRDYNTMFAVHYEDGRSAYITVSPKLLEGGDHLVLSNARDRQQKGEIPEGTIKTVKRVR